MKKFFIISLFFIPISTYAQNYSERLDSIVTNNQKYVFQYEEDGHFDYLVYFNENGLWNIEQKFEVIDRNNYSTYVWDQTRKTFNLLNQIVDGNNVLTNEYSNGTIGNLYRYTKKNYDADHNLIEAISYENYNGQWEAITKELNYYYSTNMLAQASKFNRFNEEWVLCQDIQYNTNGDCTSSVWYELEEGNPVSGSKTEYEYDGKNNWIICRSYSLDSVGEWKISDKTVRTIIYDSIGRIIEIYQKGSTSGLDTKLLYYYDMGDAGVYYTDLYFESVSMSSPSGRRYYYPQRVENGKVISYNEIYYKTNDGGKTWIMSDPLLYLFYSDEYVSEMNIIKDGIIVPGTRSESFFDEFGDVTMVIDYASNGQWWIGESGELNKSGSKIYEKDSSVLPQNIAGMDFAPYSLKYSKLLSIISKDKNDDEIERVQLYYSPITSNNIEDIHLGAEQPYYNIWGNKVSIINSNNVYLIKKDSEYKKVLVK